MPSNISDELKKILYAGVGAVATVTEKTGEVIEQLIKKGEMTVEQGRAFNEELKHKVEDAMRARPEVSEMTAEERAELRRQLDDADAKAQAECGCDESDDAACDCGCGAADEKPCDCGEDKTPEDGGNG